MSGDDLHTGGRAPSLPTEPELAALEAAVEHALASRDHAALQVLGYGEISTVLALETAAGRFACKRVPVFTDEESLACYEEVLQRYLAELAANGVIPLDTTPHRVPRAGGGVSLYLVQPALRPDQLCPEILRAASLGEAEALLRRLLGALAGAVGPRLGLDGQLSNWVVVDGRLRFLDVSTPMLRDESGREVLDTRLFTASLPWLLRGFVRRFMAKSILDKYYSLRGTVVDLLGNLVKERLDRWLPSFVQRANEILGAALGEPISIREVERYYAGDARMWDLLQRLRRADSFWQRRVRRRPYPFLLPGKITRHV